MEYDRDALRGMDREAQKETMKIWFDTYYEGPEQNTPLAEGGGYCFVHGGPYDAEEELREEFEEIVTLETIRELVREFAAHGPDWAPTHRHPHYRV